MQQAIKDYTEATQAYAEARQAETKCVLNTRRLRAIAMRAREEMRVKERELFSDDVDILVDDLIKG